MTYGEIVARLSQAGIESAEWDTALLLEHFCNVDRYTLHADSARDYRDTALLDAVEKRASRYPLQYLLGEWQFYRQTYEVSPDCLIPRADTECLVEEAIKRLPKGALFADLCTGSGCIAVSILSERPDTRAVAVEKFPHTLELAVRNAAKNAVSDRFTPICADVLTPDFLPHDLQFDAIISNPPYIRRDVLDTLEPELSAEPLAALDGGDDGLLFYREILRLASDRLKEDGFFLFEIGYDQAKELERLGQEASFSNCRVLRDLGGNDRMVILKK